MAEPLITALVASYNYGEYVAGAVESILRQEHAGPVELVVVDDGSTDNSLEVLAAFGERIRLVRQENRGQLLALRAGFAASQGEVICLLDADDAWFPEKIARVRVAFGDEEVQWVANGLSVCDDRNGPTGEVIVPPGRNGRVPGDPVLFLERRAGTATSGLCFRTDLARKFDSAVSGLEAEHSGLLRHDADRILMALAGIERATGYHIREPLGWYRRHQRQQFAAASRQMPMIERQIAVDRMVANVMSTALRKRAIPTPLYRHELVRSGVLGAGGRLRLLLQGLGSALSFAPRRPLLACRQALSLLYAFAAPHHWFAKQVGIGGEKT